MNKNNNNTSVDQGFSTSYVYYCKTSSANNESIIKIAGYVVECGTTTQLKTFDFLTANYPASCGALLPAIHVHYYKHLVWSLFCPTLDGFLNCFLLTFTALLPNIRNVDGAGDDIPAPPGLGGTHFQ